jgi:hypothetical protein
MVVFGIMCIDDTGKWELDEIYVSYKKVQKRIEELKKYYPDKRFFITGKHLIK